MLFGTAKRTTLHSLRSHFNPLQFQQDSIVLVFATNNTNHPRTAQIENDAGKFRVLGITDSQ